jgi:hypothetical protein
VVGDAADHHHQLDPLRLAGQVSQAAVDLKHRRLGRPKVIHLKKVVGHGEPGGAGLFSGLRCRGERGRQCLHSAWHVEVDEVKTHFHGDSLNVLLPNRVRRVG